jgi:hypothetical protein
VLNTKKRVHSPEKRSLKLSYLNSHLHILLKVLRQQKIERKEFFFRCVYSGNFVTVKKISFLDHFEMSHFLYGQNWFES